MRYVLGLLALAMILSFAAACRDDVIVEPPPSLSGDYTGTYSRKAGDLPEVVRPIKWEFSLDQFLMDVDTTLLGSDDRVFCDCAGIYVQADGVEIRSRNELDTNRKKQSCQPEYGPYGRFNLDQSTANVVVLRSQTTEDSVEVFRVITLNLVQ